MNVHYLKNVIAVFHQYKKLAEDAMSQIDDVGLNFTPHQDSNSIVLIVKHMSGNMLSRWTDFLTSDGEKPWRKRDSEFESGAEETRDGLMQRWDKGWTCLFHALDSLYEEDLNQTVLIRSQPLSIFEAVNRQLAHYSYHVGQIIYIAKLYKGSSFASLSIPKNKSNDFNSGLMK